MSCAKIINTDYTYTLFRQLHEEHGTADKFEDGYSPEEGMCGKILWHGPHPDPLFRSERHPIYIIALKNGKNVAVGKKGIEVLCKRRRCNG